jgi:dethiobiotin synthase
LLRGVFVTGTDTGVGKTVVSAALVSRLQGRLAKMDRILKYWKPVQTGVECDDDTAVVEWLSGCAREVLRNQGVRLPRPVSPHLAARLSGQHIDIDVLMGSTKGETAATRWIVEGAGGALVPLNQRDLMIDLMQRLGLPVVVVARTVLGTINHTLLTLEALRAREIVVAGVVMVGEPNADNRDAIETYGRIPVIGEMPRLDPLTPQSLARWASTDLDADDQLLERCFA